MRRAGVPTAMAGVFDDSRKACRFAEKLHYPIVIKADGLAAGKGVVIAPDAAGATEAITDMIDRGRFGAAGAQVLIEEFLEGWECSLHVLVAGDRYQVLGTACDHKRLHDGNEGPNTGGMGAYSPAAAWDAGLEKQFDEKIMQPLLRGLREEKIHFSGLLFPGLMITGQTARVLEFNCRFGDPETQVILPRLKGDLLPLLEATIDGRIDEVKIELDERAAVTVVMASAGYPGNVRGGEENLRPRRMRANEGRPGFPRRDTARKRRGREQRRPGAGGHRARRHDRRRTRSGLCRGRQDPFRGLPLPARHCSCRG